MIKYRIVHRYGKWSVIEYRQNSHGFYAMKVIVQPTTKKLAEAYLKLLGVGDG